MRLQRILRGLFGLFLLLGMVSGASAFAEGEPADNRGVVDRIGDTAKKVGDKIGQGFSKAGKKLEEKRIGEKIERKLNKAARKTAEGFEKGGKKIDQKLNR